MQISRQFIIEAVGLMITVAFLSMGIGMYKRAYATVEVIRDRQERMLLEAQQFDLIRYEGEKISGSEAVSYVKNVFNEYPVEIYIKTDVKEFILDDVNCALLREPQSVFYINPLKKYSCILQKDLNGIIDRVEICQVN